MKSLPIPRITLLFWKVVIVAGILTLGLGMWGFHLYGEASGQPLHLLDIVYRSLQLLLMRWESLPREVPVPVPLHIARFLGAMVSLSTIIGALLRLYREPLKWARLRRIHDHIVVCGLDRMGVRLVEGLRRRGEQVVVIEADENTAGIERCGEVGGIVLAGKSTDEWLLRKARVRHARAVISLFQEDGIKLKTALLAHGLNAGRKEGKLRCVLQVANHDFRDLFRQYFHSHQSSERFELDLFNLYEVGARVMLREVGTFMRRPEPPRLLVVGLGHLGETLVVRAAKDWIIDRTSPSQKLRIINVDRDAPARESHFRAAYPWLEQACEIEFHQLDVRSPEFRTGTFLPKTSGHSPVDAAHVCLDSEWLALPAASHLQACLSRHQVPIVMRVAEDAGQADLLQPGPGLAACRMVRVVGLQDIACTPALVLNAGRELLAQAIHQEYLRHQRLQGATPENNASMVPWRDLPEHLKESNRQQADDIDVKLKAVSCRLVPTEGEIRLRQFKEPEEVDQLALMEHDRWWQERLAAGWKWGSTKDIKGKISPYLVPWEQLTEQVKDYDRNTIRQLPALLAKADYEIVRDGSVAGNQSAG